MGRAATRITCSDEDRQKLERRAASRTEPKQVVERARILGCVARERVKEIARRCHTRPNTVIRGRSRFAEHGLKGLDDAPWVGAKRILNPPGKALLICVYEKPSIQALERATGYVETDSGKIVRGFHSTYKRHGTLNLFAALQVATGETKTSRTTLKRREEFLQLMDQIVVGAPIDRELHVVLDNYCTHKKCDAWLAQHPNVHFHFTPPPASWLNQVEIWFGIMSRKALRDASGIESGDRRVHRGIHPDRQAIQMAQA